MGCCASIDDEDQNGRSDPWKQALSGKIAEKWIVPNRTVIALDDNGNRTVIKRHSTTLEAIHEITMLGRAKTTVNPRVVRQFTTCDYIPGIDLFDYIVRERKRGTRAKGYFVLHACTLIAGAICSLHDAGICHLDIKPENVILRDGNIFDPVLIDFEFAQYKRSWRFNKRDVMELGKMKGTAGYFAPEVYGACMGGPPSDVWSFAMLVYTVLHDVQNIDGMLYVLGIDSALTRGRFAFRDMIHGQWRYGRSNRCIDINTFTMPFDANVASRITMAQYAKLLRTSSRTGLGIQKS